MASNNNSNNNLFTWFIVLFIAAACGGTASSWDSFGNGGNDTPRPKSSAVCNEHFKGGC